MHRLPSSQSKPAVYGNIMLRSIFCGHTPGRHNAAFSQFTRHPLLGVSPFHLYSLVSSSFVGGSSLFL